MLHPDGLDGCTLRCGKGVCYMSLGSDLVGVLLTGFSCKKLINSCVTRWLRGVDPRKIQDELEKGGWGERGDRLRGPLT